MSYPPAEYPGTRPYECDGTHASRKVKHVEMIEVEICMDPCCAKIFAKCDHMVYKNPELPGMGTKSICEWDESGQILNCTFCGVDGT